MTGLVKGQLLQVYDAGTWVNSPHSGEHLGFAPGRFKGYLQVVELFGDDAAIGVAYRGGGFKERDRLRFVAARP